MDNHSAEPGITKICPLLFVRRPKLKEIKGEKKKTRFLLFSRNERTFLCAMNDSRRSCQ